MSKRSRELSSSELSFDSTVVQELINYFFKNMVTLDEHGFSRFDAEEVSSMQWKIPLTPSPKKAMVTPSSGKVMLSCFCDYKDIIITYTGK